MYIRMRSALFFYAKGCVFGYFQRHRKRLAVSNEKEPKYPRSAKSVRFICKNSFRATTAFGYILPNVLRVNYSREGMIISVSVFPDGCLSIARLHGTCKLMTGEIFPLNRMAQVFSSEYIETCFIRRICCVYRHIRLNFRSRFLFSEVHLDFCP